MCHTFNKRHMLSEIPFVSEYQYHVSNYITRQLQSTNSVTLACLSPKKSHGLRTLSNRSISSKARQKAFWVLSVFHTRLTTCVILTLYKSMVRTRSLLEYFSPLWNPIEVSDIQELEFAKNLHIKDCWYETLALLGALITYVTSTTTSTFYHTYFIYCKIS